MIRNSVRSAVVLGGIVFAGSAGATTAVPNSYNLATGHQVTKSGFAVDQVPVGSRGGEQVEAVFHYYDAGNPTHWGLWWSVLRGGTAAPGEITSTSNEPVPADLNDGYVAIAEWFAVGGGASEIEVRDTFVTPGTNVNVSGNTAEKEGTPSVDGSLLAWDSDDGSVYKFDLVNLGVAFGGVRIQAGAHPSVNGDHIAFDDAGQIWIHTDSTNSTSMLSGTTAPASYPSVGGNRVAYELATTNTSIAYQDLSNPGTEVTINGPCASHTRPRMSSDGRFVIYTGTGCPTGDGAQPLYVTYFKTGGVQATYLVGDLKALDTTYMTAVPYDIDTDVIGYHTWGNPGTPAGDVNIVKMNPSAM